MDFKPRVHLRYSHDRTHFCKVLKLINVLLKQGREGGLGGGQSISNRELIKQINVCSRLALWLVEIFICYLYKL